MSPSVQWPPFQGSGKFHAATFASYPMPRSSFENGISIGVAMFTLADSVNTRKPLCNEM